MLLKSLVICIINASKTKNEIIVIVIGTAVNFEMTLGQCKGLFNSIKIN